MEKNMVLFTESADLLRVLAHPVRLCIVSGLLAKGSCNVSYMQGCLDLPQSTLSQHIQKLKAAGIIKGTRNGLEIHYQVVNPAVKEIISILCPPSQGGSHE